MKRLRAGMSRLDVASYNNEEVSKLAGVQQEAISKVVEAVTDGELANHQLVAAGDTPDGHTTVWNALESVSKFDEEHAALIETLSGPDIHSHSEMLKNLKLTMDNGTNVNGTLTQLQSQVAEAVADTAEAVTVANNTRSNLETYRNAGTGGSMGNISLQISNLEASRMGIVRDISTLISLVAALDSKVDVGAGGVQPGPSPVGVGAGVTQRQLNSSVAD